MDALLANCRTPKERKALAWKAGLTESQVLKFANMADLYRISGVGSEFAELLEVTGIYTVQELAQRNAANLAQAMIDVNEKKKLTRRVPSEAEVSKWIQQAKSLPLMLEY